MKVLQINNVFRTGSTGKITADIHDELQKNGIESVVCYGRRKGLKEKNVYKVSTELYSKWNHFLANITGIMYGGCFVSTTKLFHIIKREKPDVVHLQCLNGYFVNIYRLLHWLKKEKIPTVLTLHAEFMYTANCGHAYECNKWTKKCGECPKLKYATGSYYLDRTETSWTKMAKAFNGFHKLNIIGVSNWITERARLSPYFSGIECSTLHNGIRIDNFHTDFSEGQDKLLREKYGIPMGKKIVLHVTPGIHDSVKGGDKFIALSELLPDEYHSVIVGCDENISDKITSISFTNNQVELAGIYRMAAVFVITSTAENYPTVCIEANCCGTPVVGFDVGGVKEAIGVGMGEVVQPFDIDILLEKVLFWSNRKKEIPEQLIKERRAYCDKKRMTEEYLKVYNELLNK